MVQSAGITIRMAEARWKCQAATSPSDMEYSFHQKSVTIPKKKPCSSRHVNGARALKCGRVSTFAPNTWDPALGHVTGFAEKIGDLITESWRFGREDNQECTLTALDLMRSRRFSLLA